MQALRDRSIQQKITLVVVLISCVVLVLACAVLFVFQAWSIKDNFTRELVVMGEIVANNVATAAKSRDQEHAGQTLAGLKAMPKIVRARLVLNDGSQLARFGEQTHNGKIEAEAMRFGVHVEGNHVMLAQPVQLNGERQGTLYLDADFYAVYDDLLELYSGIAGLVLIVSLLLAYALSSSFQGFVTRPILRLTETARQIAEGRDYSVRAKKTSGDEVGVLTDAFNRMLSQIQEQDAALKVAQRKLRDQLKPLQREMAERKRAEAAQTRLTAIIDGTPDFVGSVDPTGRMLYLNPAARQMVGIAEDADISEMKLSDLHPGWAARVISTEGIPAAIHDGSWAGETGVRHLDGREIHVSQVIIAHKSVGGGLDRLSTVMRDISERKAAEEALRLSQQKLLETSRLAGMAEVATGVLHNVGNVLNSVNVSAGLVLDKLRRSKAVKLKQAAELLTARNGDLADYLTHDPSGQKLPGYLAKLGQHLVAENDQLLGEVDQLSRNIEHIKEVVAMQQSYAKVSGVFEDLSADRLVEDSIAMNAAIFERHGVKLERKFSPAAPVCVDRHRVLQVLINLIRNSKYAIDDAKRADKRITISIAPTADDAVRIAVTDNGIGISPENLRRVFGHGFTTRRDGHGFGLHSGALAAKEMGGTLTAASPGVGLGATFTLTLPCSRDRHANPTSTS
ncbi:MAG: ATP-binding protein [Chthoniobacteraceae bacterium]